MHQVQAIMSYPHNLVTTESYSMRNAESLRNLIYENDFLITSSILVDLSR